LGCASFSQPVTRGCPTESGANPLIKPYSISRLEAVLAEQLHIGRG